MVHIRNSANAKLNKTGRYIYCCVAYDEENGKLKSDDILHLFIEIFKQ